MPENMTDNEVI